MNGLGKLTGKSKGWFCLWAMSWPCKSEINLLCFSYGGAYKAWLILIKIFMLRVDGC